MSCEITITNFKEKTNNNFNFSPFQVKACNGIYENKHILVTAHTGSGKTLPAEFAIYYYIYVKKLKVIYTSPIKALSNQKYKEFIKKFPNIEIGILTGDIKHNPNADLLIMTTEILQNNCFKKQNNNMYLDFSLNIENELGAVIFDEVHYIDDIDRGTVWEQTMIMLPKHIPFIMLSATIGQKEVFAKWIENIKEKEVIICHNSERVVPLIFYEYFNIPNKYVDNITDKKKKSMFINKLKHNLNIIKQKDELKYYYLNDTKKCINELNKDKFKVHQKYVINECLEYLKQNDMFPALMFIFSRKQVEFIAKQITTPLFLENEKDYMVEPIFRQLIVRKIDNWKEYISLPEYEFYVNLLEKGIGVHHAGMLPIFRELMEILYEEKYIKILIATETFAIGLNMPTRTVLFNSLYKHDGKQLRLLKSHEFTQMAGRAGRRNIDKVGHVILLTNNYEPLMENEYNQLLHSSPKILKSKFRITYNLLLNFLNEYNEENFIKMIECSLMNLDIQKQISLSNKTIIELENEIESYKKSINHYNFNIEEFFHHYEELQNKVNLLNNKKKKVILRQIKEIEEQKHNMIYYPIYKNNKQKMQDLIKEKETKAFAENYIKDQIKTIYSILKNNKYIDENNKPLIDGLNASYIHELPCLVFYDVYKYYNKFINHNDVDILCLLSCFYELKVKDEDKIINPEFLKEELKFIQERINYYQDIELPNNLYITNSSKLQYDLMSYMKIWFNEINNIDECKLFFHKIKSETNIFIGDFIKCCLKIVNMCNELLILCENDENYNFKEKIISIKNKIQKNIVSNKSLYV